MTYSSSIAAKKQGYARRSVPSGTPRRGQNAVSFLKATRPLGPVSNTIILIVLACLIGLLYLTQVTKTNSYGYTINSLQQQQTELKNQKANLEVSTARLQSLERVANSNVAKGLVSVAPSGSISQ